MGLRRSPLMIGSVAVMSLIGRGRPSPFQKPKDSRGRRVAPSSTLKRAAHAALRLGALERLLADADVVQRLDALAPRVDLRPVEVPGGGGVHEEQREGEALVHVLGGGSVRVDDLLVADLVGVGVVLAVLVRQDRKSTRLNSS